jgi:hypothetical protein
MAPANGRDCGAITLAFGFRHCAIALNLHFSSWRRLSGPYLALTEPLFAWPRGLTTGLAAGLAAPETAFCRRIGYRELAILNGLFTRTVNHCPDRP